MIIIYTQLEEIQGSIRDRANKYRKMPAALSDVDVYTIDEYQVCHNIFQWHDWSSWRPCFYFHIGS